MNLQKELQSKLLGATTRIKADGNHLADNQMILAPLENEGSVIHLFCTGCGYTFELTRELAEKHLSSVSKTLPSIIDPGEYLETNGCGACTGPGDTFEIKSL
jgi:hypothetical protein